MNNASSVNLGGGLFKVRLSRPGQGKSGGFRSMIAYKREDRLIFLFGFSKNKKDNLGKEELSSFKKLTSDLLKLKQEQIKKLIENETLIELEFKNEKKH